MFPEGCVLDCTVLLWVSLPVECFQKDVFETVHSTFVGQSASCAFPEGCVRDCTVLFLGQSAS